MKDTAPKSLGIIAVALVFGIIGAGVALVLWDFELAGAVFIGAIVAAIAAVALMLGWREPAPLVSVAPVAPAPRAAAPAPVAAAPAPAPEPAQADPEPEVSDAPAASGEGTKPATLSAARDGGPDDLKKIKGVGPKLENLLHSMGFYHFDQIAGWGADEVAWVDQNLEGFKGRVSRDDWVAQARTLADGGATEFSQKVTKGDVY